jgi:hypothetical protein
VCLALVDAHNKIAGASRGPSAVGAAAGRWGSAVSKAPNRATFHFLGALRARAMDGEPAAAAALYALLPAAAPARTKTLNAGWDDFD